MRKVLAFLAFNVYSGCLVWAFQINTPYQFDSDMIKRLSGGDIDSPSHWGWGNHYIWRLTASVVATALAGILTGAIARTHGGLTTALSNIPSVVISVWLIHYLLAPDFAISYGDQVITAHTGMIVTSVISIILTTYVAYLAGESGANLQHDEFKDRTVLGIAGHHWIWLTVPVYIYALAGVNPIMNFFTFNFLTRDESFVGGFVSLVLLATAVASLLPLVWVYMRLKEPATTLVGGIRRAFSNAGILVIGLVAVALVQLSSHWVLGKATLLTHALRWV
jgi:hypothetical protein